jgi:hypothetical protein
VFFERLAEAEVQNELFLFISAYHQHAKSCASEMPVDGAECLRIGVWCG